MKRILLALSIAAGVAGLGFSGAALANCYNGYCPNGSSPVVGGYTLYQYHWCRQTRWSHYCENYDYIRPFGNTEHGSMYGQWMGGGTFWEYTNSNPFYCPPNTAAIQVPQGYKADNGQWYENVYDGRWVHGNTTVCVKTDTY